MPTGTSKALSTSPAMMSLTNQAGWYCSSIASPGAQRWSRPGLPSFGVDASALFMQLRIREVKLQQARSLKV